MYLEGEIYFHDLGEDQFRKVPIQHTYQLGRWWKCQRLHDYIVDESAEGELIHQELEMDEEMIQQLLHAVTADFLLRDKRPLFGRSKDDQILKTYTIETFVYAIQWIKAQQPGTLRSVCYRASW